MLCLTDRCLHTLKNRERKWDYWNRKKENILNKTLVLVGFVFFHINWYLPRAATAASNPSSSSPGISLLRFRLGGREARGRDHCNRQVKRQKIWKMSMGIWGILNSFLKWWEKVAVRLTRSAQYIEYKACQHEGQNRSIVAEVSIT